jgi:hypothetical protein
MFREATRATVSALSRTFIAVSARESWGVCPCCRHAAVAATSTIGALLIPRFFFILSLLGFIGSIVFSGFNELAV